MGGILRIGGATYPTDQHKSHGERIEMDIMSKCVYILSIAD
jgi:hypothetical protein